MGPTHSFLQPDSRQQFILIAVKVRLGGRFSLWFCNLFLLAFEGGISTKSGDLNKAFDM